MKCPTEPEHTPSAPFIPWPSDVLPLHVSANTAPHLQMNSEGHSPLSSLFPFFSVTKQIGLAGLPEPTARPEVTSEYVYYHELFITDV